MGHVPLMSRPAPSPFIGIGGRELLNHLSIFLQDEDLLTAVAAKRFGQDDWHETPATTTGARVIAVKVDFLRFGGMHRRNAGECEWSRGNTLNLAQTL